jgi:hypothetical protein
MLQVWTKLISDGHCWVLIGEILLTKGNPKKSKDMMMWVTSKSTNLLHKIL